jgi:exodeoxyribonuclease VII small subunit
LRNIRFLRQFGFWRDVLTGKRKSADAALDDVPKSFEQAIAELEKVVASMESGDLSLEASLAAYERGVVLARACQTQLQAAEQQVKVLENDLLRPFSARAEGEGADDEVLA